MDYSIVVLLVYFIPLVFIAAFVIKKRGKYKNKSNAGAFFFENDSLVLNTGIPYPIPIDEIERVELHFSSRELERKLSYELMVKVIRKNGKTKRVFYKGYRTARLALPSDMEAALLEKGIRCVMVDK